MRMIDQIVAHASAAAGRGKLSAIDAQLRADAEWSNAGAGGRRSLANWRSMSKYELLGQGAIGSYAT